MPSRVPWLVAGHNCRQVARAGRVGVLIDGDAYYTALYESLCAARHSVFLLGWDVDSRVRLVRGDGPYPYPVRLAALLDELARERPALRIHVLVWDYAAIYLFEREPLQRMRFSERTHPRVRFAVDDCHPTGASQHEKLVVIDDRVAFCGGLDVCDVRWDTPAHMAEDPLRVSQLGRHYPPHHDVQIVVDDEAACALGRIARERWQQATGEAIAEAVGEHDPWPTRARIDLRDVNVGIARTRHGNRGAPPVREVERLWLDTIERAQELIYIESPYLTSRRIARALTRRLRTPHCPEVVVMMPRRLNGWFENATTGMAGDRVIPKLREVDLQQRLHVVTPVAPHGAGEPVPVNVHSKLAIVDDVILRIGSANATDRSMRLDCECDLAIEASDAEHAAAIAGVRERLLAE